MHSLDLLEILIKLHLEEVEAVQEDLLVEVEDIQEAMEDLQVAMEDHQVAAVVHQVAMEDHQVAAVGHKEEVEDHKEEVEDHKEETEALHGVVLQEEVQLGGILLVAVEEMEHSHAIAQTSLIKLAT
jgi:hypothetical protein